MELTTISRMYVGSQEREKSQRGGITHETDDMNDSVHETIDRVERTGVGG